MRYPEYMDWRTKLIHTQTNTPVGYRSLAPSTHRASTNVFPSVAEIRSDWRQDRMPYTYGLYGTPTAVELCLRIAELEGGGHTLLTSSGQAAIALIHLSFLTPGDHVLIPHNIYGPNQELADGLISRLKVEVEYYDPLIGAQITSLLKPNTRLVWLESPGSITMETQDVPAITAAVRAHNTTHSRKVVVALDNTYAAGILFDAFAHGVDISMQALTKYVGGHSDILLASVTTQSEEIFETLGPTHRALGMAVSPDDCSLALRGLQTLGVRLAHIEQSTLTLAKWLSTRPEIELVLHPAFESCPGHEAFNRDFTGSAGIFSIVFRKGTTQQQVAAFVDTLKLFKIGYSWGGTTSLALPYPTYGRITKRYGTRLVRLNIGLEATTDLQQDLESALATISTN